MIGFKTGSVLGLVALVTAGLITACGGQDVVEKAVEVTREVPVEKIVERTVLVEKPVEKVVQQTVLVEKPVEKRVVETVVVFATVQPTATPVQAPKVPPAGQVLIAVDNTYFMNSYPRYCPACSVTARTGAIETLLEAVRAPGGDIGLGPLLAKEWKLSADGKSYMDFKLRDDVQFHHGWGRLTAEDVAWTWNESNPNVAKDVVHDTGGEIGAAVARVEVIDEFTVRFHWKAYAGHIPMQLLTNYSEGIGILSKKFHDTVGPDRMKQELVGTGPYVMVEWIEHKGAIVDAQDAHWRKVPWVKRIQFIEVPEASIRKAMLKAGQAQISQVETQDWVEMLGAGFKRAPEGLSQNVAPLFVGNYWENTSLVDGKPLTSDKPGDPYYKPMRDVSKAWIGDPDKPDTMERAKKVRTALAMTIDRDVLVKLFAPGFGWPEFVPGWDNPQHPLYKKAWEIPYDPAGARQLLKDAGYPNGFEVDYWAGGTSFATGGEAEAIAAMWQKELGVSAKLDKTVYSSVRPSLVDRTFRKIFNWSGPTGPKTWPAGRSDSTISRPGLSRGVEVAAFGEVAKKMETETDPAELAKLAQSWWDYNREWVLFVGGFGKPAAALYDPNKIESWRMLPEGRGLMGRVNSVEYIKLKK